MKILFMGTPDFAVGALEALIEAGHEVVCVVTQPDKPKGRGISKGANQQVQFTPVKECAYKHDIPVFQPVKIKAPEAVEQLRQYGADLFVVAAFGQILSQEILDMPRFGCMNIHASLLPKYRGAAPIQWAIIEGERESGVTIMQMNAGLDTGDMLTKKRVAITDTDTGESLHDKLSEAGAALIVETISLLERGALEPQPQDDSLSCYAKMLHKSMGQMDWSRPAKELDRLIRGLNPWPSAYTSYHGKVLKIWEAQPAEGTAEPGRIAAVEKDAVLVGTGQGLLRLTKVQLAGKKRMDMKDFLLGYQLRPGEEFGK